MMAKKKTNTPKTPTKSTTKKQKLSALEKLSEVSAGKVVTIPDDAIINVPISGSFKKAIEETLHFTMAPMSADEIIIAMRRIRGGFKDVDPLQVTDKERSIWVLMSIISEINFQAAEQKKTIITDENVSERMSDIISAIDTDTAIGDMIDFNKEYKDFQSDRAKAKDNTDEND